MASYGRPPQRHCCWTLSWNRHCCYPRYHPVGCGDSTLAGAAAGAGADADAVARSMMDGEVDSIHRHGRTDGATADADAGGGDAAAAAAADDVRVPMTM